ncbi:ABC transporter ATP-binding protein [Micromonospora arborensis]|uniref:ABC transporter ATP-binding protein n=1 Tax=Micromonospora arborensis TaxID=2116518 RepID=UPI0037195B5E
MRERLRQWRRTAKLTGAGAFDAAALAAKAAPRQVLAYAGGTLVAGILPVAAAWLTKLLLDGIVAGAGLGRLLLTVSALAVTGALTALLPELSQFLKSEIERASGLVALDRLFAAVGRLPGLSRFEDPAFLDRLRLAQHASSASPIQLLEGTFGTAQSVITVCGFAGVLFTLNPLLAVFLLLSGVPTLVTELSLARDRSVMMLNVGAAERREFFYRDLLSSVGAAKETRLFNLGALLRDRMGRERRSANAARRDTDRRALFSQGALGLFAALLAAAGTFWAVYQAYVGAVTPGGIVVFIAAVTNVQTTLAAFARQIAGSHQALLLFEHYRYVVRLEPDLPVPAAPAPLGPLADAIEFHDVWFRYSEDHPWILKGVSFRIPARRSVALVGLNGAGKSTVVKLLCRFYDPAKGVISWDGRDIREVDPAALRARISAVFQDYMNYDLTAAENIGLGDTGAMYDQHRIGGAAERAGIDAAIRSLASGYQTLLSRTFFMQADREDSRYGVVLSGGQWQRIALARAFFRNEPDVVILDEPSSGLDAEAEQAIHQSLGRYRAHRASLLISHRLGAVKDADAIVVLSGGEVVEEGNHDELISLGRQYARLFDLQASAYRDTYETTEASSRDVLGP